MLRTFATLLLIATLTTPNLSTVIGMKTGILLRMHVIAQDDSAEMQRIKLCVRDAVQEAYAASANQGSMLLNAWRLLPQLSAAAQDAARREGFSQPVQVCIEFQSFDQQTLDGITFPAGNYPALMIRLGEARGHNWWGLVDPELALDCASLPQEGWDWSLSGFWQALIQWFQEVSTHA